MNASERTIIDKMRIREWFVPVLLCVLACSVRGSDIPCAGSMTSPVTQDSHAWMASPTRSGMVRILHLPPRGTDARGRRGAADGAVRVASVLAQSPEALAAIENRLYMAFPPRATAGAPLVRRQILLLEAERGSIDGTWVGDAGSERLPVLPSLPGDALLRGFVGSPAGPVAFLERDGPDGIPQEELLLLNGAVWSPIPLPPGIAGRTLDAAALIGPDLGGRQVQSDTGLRLTAHADGIGLVVLDGPSPGVWALKLDAKKPVATNSTWKWSGLSFESGTAEGRIRPRGEVLRVRDQHDQYVFERRNFQSLELWRVDAGGCRRFAVIPQVEPGYGVVSLDQTGRIAVVWIESSHSQSLGVGSVDPPEAKTRIFEVSALTGQKFYDGDVDRQLPFSATEVKILAVFLVVVMLAIVIFVLRPERTGPPITLPKGFWLAEPGRRLFAAALDLVVATVAATEVTGIKISQIASMDGVLKETRAVWLFLATIGIGIVLGTLTEWLFGRTPGKALTGCQVVKPRSVTSPAGEVSIDLVHPDLWRAAVRNIVKWLVPPVAISGLSTGERRHRGDTAAGTVVVVQGDPEET